MIKLKYSSVDGGWKLKSFKTLKGARKYAQYWIGKNPEMGSTYAVSGDGIGKIQVFEGAKLADLFGDEKPAAQAAAEPEAGAEDDWLDDFNYVGSRHHY